MRTVRISMIVALVSGLAVASCVDNEVTFYVEHMKVQPDAPQCVSSPGDEQAASGLVDLAVAQSYAGYYYVTNAAMEKEAYDNLRAETDGIFIEGAEVYVRGGGDGSGVVGGSEYYLFNQFLAAESSDIVPAVAMPPAVVLALAEQGGCRRAESYTGEEIEAAMLAADGSWPPQATSSDYVYTVIRFIGHTQGGSDVMTQEYSFLVNLCCNCLVDWSECTDGCGTFCETGEETEMCNVGTASGSGSIVDCRDLGYGRLGSWQEYDEFGFLVDMDCNQCTVE